MTPIHGSPGEIHELARYEVRPEHSMSALRRSTNSSRMFVRASLERSATRSGKRQVGLRGSSTSSSGETRKPIASMANRLPSKSLREFSTRTALTRSSSPPTDRWMPMPHFAGFRTHRQVLNYTM
jgi:hypothetical protein